MASAPPPNSMDLLQSIEVDRPDRRIVKFLSENMTFASAPPPDVHDHCDHPSQDHFPSAFQHIHGSGPMQDDFGGDLDGVDAVITMDSTTKMAGKTVAPFLAKHIPDQYAPLGAPALANASRKDPNTKYCYRHRPDSKCRRTADEPTMEILQRNLETLSQADQQGISHVWSLFSAAPAKHRDLMLQGILTQCCFPQLSYLSSQVRDLIRIDFLSALPSEISFKVLCYLDTTSLCKAAQVSQRWRILADDDVVWHKMCEQHIDRKCTKCGWGLPLLERKRLRDWKRQQQLRASGRGLNEWSPHLTPTPEDRSQEFLKTLVMNGPTKRSASSLTSESSLPSSSTGNKRARIEEAKPTKFRPWKDVYKDRFKVGTNWKYGRCSTKTFRGHTNGVMCLQFDDNILATGSYDTTIKIWNMDTGECIRTLKGHTSGVRTLQFDDTKLISGSLDRTIKVWNWRTGECISTLDGHTEGVVAVHFEGPYIVSGSVDKTVRVYDFKDKKTQTLTGHKDWVNSVKVDSQSRTLFSASDDCTVRLWDLDTMKTIQIFEGHVGQVQQVILLPAEYEPDEVEPEDAEDGSSGNTERYSPPHSPELSTFANWPAGRPQPVRYMMTAGLDSTVRLWDINSGRCIKTFFGHVEGVWGLAADSLRVVSGGEDRMVKVWDARSGRCQRTFTGHVGPVTCVGLSDSRMVTGSEDCEIRLYSFKSDDGADLQTVQGEMAAAATNISTPSSSTV